MPKKKLKKVVKRPRIKKKSKLKSMASDLYFAFEGDILGGNYRRKVKADLADMRTAQIKKQVAEGTYGRYQELLKKEKKAKKNKFKILNRD